MPVLFNPAASVVNATSEAPRADNKLLTAWLLLLVARGAVHGYELGRALRRHGVGADASRIYRLLRKLEQEGCIASRWMESAAGPRRRQYELTPTGRCDLEQLAASMCETRDRYDQFVHIHHDDLAGLSPAALE